MKEYKFNTTNYEDIENKSVWDLYVENFRDHLFELCPAVNIFGEEKDDNTEQEEKPAKPKKKKSKKKIKNLTLPPFRKEDDKTSPSS